MTTTNKITYETGATSHIVNDLILFADNTRKLAELRDSIYMQGIEPAENDIIKSHLSGFFGNGECSGYAGTIEERVINILQKRFSRLFYETLEAYKKEFPNNYYLPTGEVGDNVVTYEEREEFCTLYAQDFKNWKKEHGYPN